LLFPPGPGPFPAFVLLHGSGAETRAGNKGFAYFLASQGIASLIYDKRGTGSSTGESSDAPFGELASDAIAGLELMRSDARIDSRRAGLFGPSQGGWIALQATTMSPHIAFMIIQSGDTGTPLDQEMYRGEKLLHLFTKLNDDEIREAVTFRRAKFLFAITGQNPERYQQLLVEARTKSWFRQVGDGLPNARFWKPNGLFNPEPALRSYTRPILAVFGEKDTNKDAEKEASAMNAIFLASGNTAANAVVLRGGNHGLFETMTGLPLERELSSLTRLVPEYLPLLRSWLSRWVLTPRSGK
jgi:pimeloyl-ACP methyl ester carboxylesterase